MLRDRWSLPGSYGQMVYRSVALQCLLWVESSRFNNQKYDEFRTNLGQISLIVLRNIQIIRVTCIFRDSFSFAQTFLLMTLEMRFYLASSQNTLK